MQILQGEKIYLRALETEDLDFLYQIENNSSYWEVSNTVTPYSKHVLTQYLANAHLDIYEAKQLRLVVVEKNSDQAVGCIDLFDFDPQHWRAGIGILIEEQDQQKGYAFESLELLISYCFDSLNIHQLFANISSDNLASIALFKKSGFREVGVKKDWIFIKGEFNDEVLFQLIKK